MSALLNGVRTAPSRCLHDFLLPVLLLLLALLAAPSRAVFISFDNCLDPSILDSQPLRLQWVPLFFDARFDPSDPDYPLDLALYGNVTGKQFNETYPPPSSPSWSDPSDALGKITNTGSDGKEYTTLFSKFDFLSYNAYNAPPVRFCADVVNGTCPLGPLFAADPTDPTQLHRFAVSHQFHSSYAFSTLVATIVIEDGELPPTDLACVSASITPDLGSRIKNLLIWLPAVILIFKGVATLTAAIYSPWGSSDIFRWSSNYGRDEDLLRLVTPGFGDCLQYIQFIALTGSLTLQYPGFYQPAVRYTSWSLLLFNESFASHGPGTQALVDGIYVTDANYGLERMSQLIGMSQVQDIWPCMAIWLLVIAAAIILLCQLGFLARWVHRRVTGTTEEDLRRKNLPFTMGNLIRLLFNFFILPIVALSFFQLVVAPRSMISLVVTAVVLLAVMLLSAFWILRFIFVTKPRTFLFDDMPTVLLYGPFYNTYSDSAALFALVPVFITFMRGVAIGAVQPSGIAQIIILAVCEVILILTLNGLRPFQGQTSMNFYHTVFSAVRLITLLLAIAFVPPLGVTEGPRGWIGYVILILHACVLVFGFFLNAAQTLLEVVARSFGVGGDSQHGAVRGSILTLRMLKKRRDRPATGDGHSLMSSAAILQDHPDAYGEARSRSMSASSQQLLNQTGRSITPSTHRLSGFETFSANEDPNPESESSYTHTAVGKQSRSIDNPNATDNFYRPPRPRRGTVDALTPGAKSRRSGGSVDFPYSDSPGIPSKAADGNEAAYFARRESAAAAAAAPHFREHADPDETGPRPDYAVREVDQYYRGAALSGAPKRKLKTGPADPEGPAANAQSWFQRLVFGVQGKDKQKEPTKGFEVVRSTRVPPEMQQGGGAPGGQEDFEMVNSPPMHATPYRDSPPSSATLREHQASAGAARELTVRDPNAEHVPANQRRSVPFQFGFDGPSDLPAAPAEPSAQRWRPSRALAPLTLTHATPSPRPPITNPLTTGCAPSMAWSGPTAPATRLPSIPPAQARMPPTLVSQPFTAPRPTTHPTFPPAPPPDNTTWSHSTAEAQAVLAAAAAAAGRAGSRRWSSTASARPWTLHRRSSVSVLASDPPLRSWSGPPALSSATVAPLTASRGTASAPFRSLAPLRCLGMRRGEG